MAKKWILPKLMRAVDQKPGYNLEWPKLLHAISGQVPSLTESTSTERSPALGIPGLPLREREPSMKNSMLSPACNTCTMYCRKMGGRGGRKEGGGKGGDERKGRMGEEEGGSQVCDL